MRKVLLFIDNITANSIGTKTILNSFIKYNISVQLFNINKDNFDILYTLNPKIVMNRVDVYSSEMRVAFLIFEDKQIPILNKDFEQTNNKFLTSTILKHKNISIIPTLNINKKNIDYVINKISLPLVIKGTEGYGGEQVYKLDSRNEILSKIENTNIFYIAQPYIECSNEDFRVIVCKNKVIKIIKRKSENDFRANLCLGGKYEEIQDNILSQIALRVLEILKLDILGLDFIFDGKEYLFCEANNCFAVIDEETADSFISEIINIYNL